MTVCIAAVAANAKAIVMVADRSVSYLRDNQTVLKADVAVNKIRPLLGAPWTALISGPMDFGEDVIGIANTYLAMQKDNRQQTMGEIAKAAYQEMRRRLAIDHVLKPKMLTAEWYEEKIKNPISRNDDFFLAVAKEINEFYTGSSMIFCGFEQGTEPVPEIYTVTSPGLLGSASAEGFGAVGIGQDTALKRLYALETDPTDEIGKVLYDLFDAKEECTESIPDVGRDWNAAVMTASGEPFFLSDDHLKAIENVYDAYPKSPFAPKKRLPKNWRNTLRDIGDAALKGVAGQSPRFLFTESKEKPS